MKSWNAMSDHHPPHLYIDDTWYMITASTINHAPFLKNDQVKVLVRDTFEALIQTFDISLLAWVILDNHYHLLLKMNIGRDVSRFISRLHGRTSRQMNLQNNAVGRQVWHNYWDTCIRTEAGMWTRFNYIHHNPVKHGYVHNLEDWPFSSYRIYLAEKGVEWLEDCWQTYPVIDFLNDDFDNPTR
jgi:putative transposase